MPHAGARATARRIDGLPASGHAWRMPNPPTPTTQPTGPGGLAFPLVEDERGTPDRLRIVERREVMRRRLGIAFEVRLLDRQSLAKHPVAQRDDLLDASAANREGLRSNDDVTQGHHSC